MVKIIYKILYVISKLTIYKVRYDYLHQTYTMDIYLLYTEMVFELNEWQHNHLNKMEAHFQVWSLYQFTR